MTISFNKFLLIILSIVCSITNNYSQSHKICAIEHSALVDYEKEQDWLEFDFKNTKEAYKYIGTLLKKVGIPMNFHVYECVEANCTKYQKNNAFASMNKSGTRFIIYDNNWFKTLDTDTNKIESLTILAHEIGHHLAAHTLSLNYLNHRNAYKFCYPNSSSYNKSICKSQYSTDYKEYLAQSRRQELQADRFAGYIMSAYGANLVDVKRVFTKISNDNNDISSTHPRLSKRLKAIEDGYKIAASDKKSGVTVDIMKIKGNPIELIISESKIIKTIKENEERQDLIVNIQKNLIKKPVDYIRKNSQYSFYTTTAGGSIPSKIKERINQYLGPNNNYTFGRKNTGNEVFEFLNTHIRFKGNHKISYNPQYAYHIKDGILNIISFENEEPKILYTSVANKKNVSFKEIESIAIEMYQYGLQGIINKLENNLTIGN